MLCGASKSAKEKNNSLQKQNLMLHMKEHLIGYVGGIFSSVSFLPHVIKIRKTKSAGDVNGDAVFTCY